MTEAKLRAQTCRNLNTGTPWTVWGNITSHTIEQVKNPRYFDSGYNSIFEVNDFIEVFIDWDVDGRSEKALLKFLIVGKDANLGQVTVTQIEEMIFTQTGQTAEAE